MGGDNMAQGAIKRGKENSKQIPLEKPVWFVVFSIEDGKIKERTFSTTKVQKKALFKILVLIGCEKVYGVWNGQWNTNLFDMDITILKKRLAQDLQMTITEMKEKVWKDSKRLTEAGGELQRGAKVLR